ncbi:hypothetical protein [Angustibacter luteus]|uniref:NIL domain-containing protein n=1 Tax=Angustibacter luteus TaxID=658456 RepID=A0ABW1JK77_9ACTN
MTGELRVEVTVRGRVDLLLGQVLPTLDVTVVPRHNVLTVASGDVGELKALLETLARRGIEVDRVTR